MTVALEESRSGLKHQQDNHCGMNNTWGEWGAHWLKAVCFYSALRREREIKPEREEGRESVRECESDMERERRQWSSARWFNGHVALCCALWALTSLPGSFCCLSGSEFYVLSKLDNIITYNFIYFSYLLWEFVKFGWWNLKGTSKNLNGSPQSIFQTWG